MHKKIVIILDDESRHRAQMVSLLGSKGWYVEPYENARELANFWPEAGIFLVKDAGSQIHEALELVRFSGSWRPIIAYSDVINSTRVVDCLRIGVVDYLSFYDIESSIDERVKLIEGKSNPFIYRYRRWMEARLRLQKLTNREKEILERVASGESTKAIASELSISSRTVESHRANIRGKLDGQTTTDIVRLMFETNLFNSDEGFY